METAILFPLIVVLLFGGLQTAVWFYGRQVAAAAAAAGARAGAELHAPAGAGVAAAQGFLAASGGNGLEDASAAESGGPAAVTVTVTGRVPLVIPLPGLDPRVQVSVSQPRERFTTAAPGGGP